MRLLQPIQEQMRQQCAHKAERVYRRRHPEKTPFYSVLFHHFDRFVGEYDLRFEKHYGKWRTVIAYAVYVGPAILQKEDAVRVGLYIVSAPAAASRL